MLVRKKYIIILLAMLFWAYESMSQVPDGYMREFKYLDNSDTLLIHRYHGDWWFGAFAGPNIDLFFGDLFSKEYSPLPGIDNNRTISFNSTFGGGYYFGGTAEYRPRNQHWGYSLGISFFDRKAFSTLSEKLKDTFQTQYEMRSVLDYLIISPGIKYYSKLSGLYYFASIDIGFNLAAASKQRKKFVNTADIDQWFTLSELEGNTRLELNLGAGYEFLLADFAGIGRIHGNPYISLNAGTNVISNLNSSWNAIGFKAGFALKFGKDYQEFETFKFDPSYEPPIYAMAQVVLDGIEFPGFTHSNPLPAQELAYIEDPVIIEEVAQVDKPEFAEEIKQRERGQIRNRIVPDQLASFSFDKSESTSLSKEQEQYLDLIADYMKTNPKVEVRITGHSDNRGSINENTQRALSRANNARSYLIKKGIPATRVLTTGRGALIPVAPNDTPANQRRNRRIEIIVVGR